MYDLYDSEGEEIVCISRFSEKDCKEVTNDGYYFNTLVEEVCRVCNKKYYDYTYKTFSNVWITKVDVVKHGEYFYVIFADPDHASCKELFKLNPLAYE